MKTFFNLLGGWFPVIIETLFCVGGYFLLNATIATITHGGLTTVVGWALLFPLCAAVLLSGLLSSVTGIIKGALAGRKWYLLLIQFLILCAFVLVIVLNFV